MTGLYFYKLVSPYKDDVTKNCKLTVNEIDNNFVTLKDADIADAVYNEKSNQVTLTRNNGDTLDVDLSPIVDKMASNLEVDYDSMRGTITISYNDKQAVFNGIITKDNISKAILTEVITDSTLKGSGTDHQPLGISLTEQTGSLRPAKKVINLAKGEFLPSPDTLTYGDSYVVYEKSNDYGFLYNYSAVKQMNQELTHGWRVPSKADWDNMLNAIEPCERDKNHDSGMSNALLGKFAGKLLKKNTRWVEAEADAWDNIEETQHGCEFDPEEFKPHHPHHPHHMDDIFDRPRHHHLHDPFHEHEDFDMPKPHRDIDGEEYFDAEEIMMRELKKKHHDPKGTDAFKMGILPAGYGDGCRIMAYFGKRGEYWSSTMTDSMDVYTKRFDYDKCGVIQNLQSPSALYSIRLVKDYDGQNFHEVESINGQDYPCVLLPSEHSKFGFAIWTAVNIALPQYRYNPVLPNRGEGLDQGSKTNFYLYSWVGKDFVKKDIKEGQSIVLEQGLNNDYNSEYRLMHGKLVNTSEIIYDDVIRTFNPRIEEIERILKDNSGSTSGVSAEIKAVENALNDLTEKLTQEILDRQTQDSGLSDSISALTETNEQEHQEIWDSINELSGSISGNSSTISGLNDEMKVVMDILDEISGFTGETSAVTESITKEVEKLVIEKAIISASVETIKEQVTTLETKVTELEGESITGGTLDIAKGELILGKKNGDNITITFTSDYGARI